MAFSLRSRAGWNRLWVVLAVLWWICVALYGANNYPQRDMIDYRYRYALTRLHAPMTPSELRASQEVEPPKVRGSDLDAIFGLTEEKAPTPAMIEKRRAEATQLRDEELAELPGRQHRYLMDVSLTLLVPFVVYLFIRLLIAVAFWVYRGFSKV